MIARSVNIVYWLGLVLWVSAMLTAGVAAYAVFGTLLDESLGLSLSAYASFPSEHAQHGRLAAGTIMEKVFTISDYMQVVAAVMVVVGLFGQLVMAGRARRRPSNIIRVACLAGVLGLLVFRVFMLAPEMNHNLRSYWEMARVGSVDAARRHRDAFEQDHPTASNVLTVSLVLLLVMVAASASAMTPMGSRRPDGALEQPELARRA